MKNGFTNDEELIMQKLVDAHNIYAAMEQQHPSDMNEWVTAIHTLQQLIGMRILRREHPEIFATIKK